MSPRQKVLVPFGGGLDRATGSAVVEPDSFADLRNVVLVKGRMSARKGMGRVLSVGWGDVIVGVFPIKKQGLAGIVVFDETTGETRLYSVDGTLATVSLVGTLWTVPAGAAIGVTGADAYNNLVVAHDEPTLSRRQVTRVYQLSDSTLQDLEGDLSRQGAPYPIRFRGVARHLNFLLGWGYGGETDEDRAEMLRISRRGLATAISDWFVPEQFFTVGTPGDAILGGEKLGRVFIVGKSDELYRLTGYDPANFDVEPVDPNFGYLNGRLHVTTTDEHFFWSAAGPRVTRGDGSVALDLPLNLPGPDPDPLVSATEADDGFAYFLPDKGSVVFTFDHWEYVLHLKDGARRWSYQERGRILRSVGRIYEGGATTLDLPAATLGTLSYVEPSYVAPDYEPKVTVPWTASGAGVGDQVEVWVRSTYGSDAWSKLATEDASTGTVTVVVPRFLTAHQVAVRLTRGGLPGAGYTGSPDTWPASAQGTITTGGVVSTFTNDGPWGRDVGTSHGTVLSFAGAGMGGTHPELSFYYEHSFNSGGTWADHVTSAAPLTRSQHPNPSDPTTSARYRLTIIGPDASSAVSAETVDRAIGAAAPGGTTISADLGDLVGQHDHPVEIASRGANGADGVVEVEAYHTDGSSTTYSDTVEELSDPDLGPVDLAVNDTPATPRDAYGRARLRIDWFGETDYSEWDVSSPLSEP